MVLSPKAKNYKITSMAGPNFQATAATNNESDSKVKPLSYKIKTILYHIYPKKAASCELKMISTPSENITTL